MFGGSRRHRPPVQPLTKETANPNAATAAASAFMRRETSTSLSSAAAAAALRARPTTPTNVAEVQTKRTARRSPSVSSIGSRDGGRRGLHRSPSVGSMSERSFRSPSPGRGPAPHHQHVPPVPKLPAGSQVAATKATGNGALRKGPGLQTQPFRTASQKMKDGQSDSWFGAAKARSSTNVRKSDAALQTSFVSEDGRPGSISPSINFSYPRPRSSSIDSYNTPSPIVDNAMVYDPNSRRMVPKIDLFERQYAVREASEKPVKKKKAQEVSRSGSHLSKGTMGRTKAPTLESQPSDQARSVPPLEPTTSIQPTTENASQEQQPEIESPDVSLEEGNASHLEAAALQSLPLHRSSPGPQHFPGVVETTVPPTNSSERSVARTEPEPASVPGADSADPEQLDNDGGPVEDAGPVNYSLAESQPVHKPTGVDEAMEDKGLVDEKPNTVVTRQQNSGRRNRVHSESPARTAHFATATDQLVVRHEPPSRSLSPRKSALKHRSPSRGASPSDDSSEASGSGLGANLREESSLSRKKSARVSFDQNTVVVGEAAPRVAEMDSPVAASPQAQTKKPWLGLVGKHNRKEHPPLDEDETMTPRPALPLFGSVREKKTKEPEERPLVRPLERTWSPSPASPAHRQSSPFNSPAPNLPKPNDTSNELSSMQDQPAKNAANISKYREPLPPVVTSVEGSGYISNSAESSDNEEETERVNLGNVAIQAPTTLKKAADVPQTQGTDEVQAKEPDISLTHAAAGAERPQNNLEPANSASPPANRVVPDISISLPSPPPQSTPQPFITPQQEYFDVPGGFPEDDDTPEEKTVGGPNSSKPANDAMAASKQDGVVEPELNDVELSAPSTSPPNLELTSDTTTDYHPHGPTMADIEELDEMTDSSSIYSDAYEDLSDVDGDGFMSLDAVLTAPVSKKGLEKSPSKPVSKAAPAAEAADITPPSPSQISIEKPPHAPDDWENAKAYWRSLTTEKRRQLEVEAMVEGGDAPDEVQEDEPKKAQSSMANGNITKATPRELTNGQDRSYQIRPGTKWPSNGTPSVSEGSKATRSPAKSDHSGSMKLRKSMRQQEPVSNGSPFHQGTMRKSLRSGGPTNTHGNQVQSVSATGSPSKLSSRPMSHQPRSTTELTKDHKRNYSVEGQLPKSDSFTNTTGKSSLRRRGSDASESSFTRTRATLGEGFGFKKTMRNSMYEPISTKPPEQSKGSSRFSLRSLSPSGSAFRRSSIASSPPPAQGSRIRHSLRNEPNEGAQQRMRLPTFSKSSGKKTKSNKDGSRFADSSDEEDRSAAFNSRFADSSDDEDIPAPFNKGQGLPKTLRNTASSSAAAAAMGGASLGSTGRLESNSPDLPDSSDDEVAQPKRRNTNGTANGKATTTVQRSGSGRGHMVAANHKPPTEPQTEPAVRPAQSRRGSFMSTILRRKKGSAGKISKGMNESAARRDTPLERSNEELSMIRTGSNGKPRLQRRGPSWPFPDEVDQGTATAYGASNKARPSTAGGPVESSPKTNYLRRRSASYNGPAAAAPVTADDGEPPQSVEPLAAHKKKKFGTLRKMFRLHD